MISTALDDASCQTASHFLSLRRDHDGDARLSGCRDRGEYLRLNLKPAGLLF